MQPKGPTCTSKHILGRMLLFGPISRIRQKLTRKPKEKEEEQNGVAPRTDQGGPPWRTTVPDITGACMNMASFAGKIGFKISSQLQCRVYSVPWAIWKNQVTCLKSRDHSSSAPVRYTPKTSSKVKLSETSPQVKNLEKSNYFSRADISALEIDCEESERGKIGQCEASQIHNEMQNNLLFDDMGQ
ncbi:uncharacterized protein LOC114745177, partial [Neltuma alba]|uniref:uncharacterized protein LOC114745177 n=1 Tax=Neltuma alba TaxID=207710 RepID=UPI0010A3ACA8